MLREDCKSSQSRKPRTFSSATGNVLRHEIIESDSLEGNPSLRKKSMVKVKQMLNDAGE